MEEHAKPQISHLKEFDEPNFLNSTFRLDRPSMYLINRARKDELGGYSKLKDSLTSATIYIGHLMLNTTEEQIYEVFSQCGRIKRVIMGLNAHDQSPTGFCFVVFRSPKGALDSVKYLNKTKINGRTIEIDLDSGFEDGRQYGRGENGAQKSQYHPNRRSYRSGGRDGSRGRFNRRGRGRGGRGGRGRGRGRDRDSGYQGYQGYQDYQAYQAYDAYGHGQQQGYQQGYPQEYQPAYQQNYEPSGYHQGYQPEYQQNYQPYQQGYQDGGPAHANAPNPPYHDQYGQSNQYQQHQQAYPPADRYNDQYSQHQGPQNDIPYHPTYMDDQNF